MNIALTYLYPLNNRTEFSKNAYRWAESYAKFPPGEPHRVIVSLCNGSATDADREIFKGCTLDETYQGGGWDIGAYQHLAAHHDADLMVFTNSRVRFWKEGWLTRFVEAYEKYGEKGLYGASASFETNPHIRTACFATDPKLLRKFPYIVNSREEGFKFESGDWNIMEWYRDHGYPVKMVTWDGFYDFPDWRRPANIWRRGDQTNCLVWDRHHDIYFSATHAEKAELSFRADTLRR